MTGYRRANEAATMAEAMARREVSESQMQELRRYFEQQPQTVAASSLAGLLGAPPTQLIVTPTPRPDYGESIMGRALAEASRHRPPEWTRQMIYGEPPRFEENEAQRNDRFIREAEESRRLSEMNPFNRRHRLTEASLRAQEALRAVGAADEHDDTVRFLRSMAEEIDPDERAPVGSRPAPPAPEPERKVESFKPGRTLEL